MTTISSPDTAATSEAGREFWRGLLTAGGSTAIPRWSLRPVAGVAGHEAAIPNDLAAALRRRADELAVPLGSVLLAAHAKVLAALSGEPEVVTGYVAGGGGAPLPCRLATGPGSWRSLLLEAHSAEARLLSHKDFPVGDLRRELGVTGPSFETEIDPAGLDPADHGGDGHGDGDGDGDGEAMEAATAAGWPLAPCCGWGSAGAAAGWCCGCGTGPRCLTRTARPGSPVIT